MQYTCKRLRSIVFGMAHSDRIVVVLLDKHFRSTLQLFSIFFGTGFEVLKVVRIHNAIWVRTLYSLVVNVLCPFHRPSKDGGSMPKPKPRYPPVRLHGPIT
jgi:hypothetical protein